MQPSPFENKAERHGKRPSQKYLLKKEQILHKAAEKFNMMGVRGATLADVAVAVDLNLTSIRHYFLRKDDLVAACFLRSIEVHRVRLEKSKRAGSREARVRDMMHRYFDFRRGVRSGEHPEVMIFGDLRALAEPQASEVWPKYVGLFKLVREIVSDPEEMDNDRQRVNARAHMLISQLMRSVFWLPEYEVADFERVEARLVDILLNGIAAPGVEARGGLAVLDEEAPPDKRSLDSFLLAATELINEQGYRGASVERIAAKLNVTKGSFYHHIEAKGDLVVACFQRNTEILAQAQRGAIRTEKLGAHQAAAAVGALIRRQQTAAGPLMRNSALMSVDPPTRTMMLQQMDQVVDRFVDMIADGIIDGSARSCDPRIAGQMLMAQVNSAAELGKWAPNLTPENSIDLYARPLFKGLFA
ncbi:MAG: TetR/AcrR family transcriptional regulator [Hyphomonadaceae bacterium]|nr:TetR/AcrR family transcriptional regulator [Hyphomonadaceae bacterium]